MLYSEEPEPGRYPVSPFKRFVNCYGLRTFSRFLGWFGWVEGDSERLMREDVKVVVASEVFRSVFETDETAVQR